MADIIAQAVLNKARQDKFLLIVNTPEVLKNITSRNTRSNKLVNLDSLQYSLYNCPVPAVASPAIDLPYQTQTFHVASYTRRGYDPITVNFVVDNEYKNYWFLWKWLQVLNDPREGLYVGEKISNIDDSKNKYMYVTDFHLYARDEYNNNKIRFDYKDCFITELGGIEYNQRETNEIECNFKFSFNQFFVTLLDSDDPMEQIPPEANISTNIF